MRIVHNFKPLNALISDDTADVPGINEAFNAISSANPGIFSKIDLANAYLQIPLRVDDRPLTAFTCDGERLRFVTAPLGIKTIPSQFQRELKALLQSRGCLTFCRNHIDDIIIFSATTEQHVVHVKMVLQALTDMNLTIHDKKCIFFAVQLPILGFIVRVGRHGTEC